MRYVKLGPNVANTTCGRKVLSDKDAVWPETMWKKDVLEDLLRRKFLVIAEEPERKIDSPDDAGKKEDPKTTKRKLTKEDFKNNPELKIQGFKVGDEYEFPADENQVGSPGPESGSQSSEENN